MEQKEITLELLVQSANVKGVEIFAKKEHLPKKIQKEKMAEAGIYSAIHLMREEAEGGIDGRRVAQFLGQKHFSDYFRQTQNESIIQKIIDAVKMGTRANMEAYVQIAALEVLGVQPLADAIKRISSKSQDMMAHVEKLINDGYSLVFCPY